MFFLCMSYPLKSMDKIQHKKTYFNDFFENNHTIMIVVDPKTGVIMDANEAACSFYQYNYDNIMKLKISDINVLSIEKIVK